MTLPSANQLTVADKWILTRLHDTVNAATAALDAYDFGNVAETLWRFIWYEVCDWYLEATKDDYAKNSRAAVLSFVLNNAMRLLHPIAPFISEEVWLTLPHDGQTIMTATWPDPAEIPVDREAAQVYEALQRTAERLRNLKADIGMAQREPLQIQVSATLSEELASLLATHAIGTIERTNGAFRDPVEALTAARGVAPKGVLAERYKKEELRLRSEVERGETKLANERFVANAKAEVVAKEREKLEGYRAQLARIQAALKEMGESE
jgi:valyl-tRNA synthetase